MRARTVKEKRRSNRNKKAFCISLLVLFALSFSGAEPEYFVSDSNGTAYEKISKYRTAGSSYSLKVERTSNLETRILSKNNGQEENRRLIEYSDANIIKEEKIYKGGRLILTSSYDASGRLAREYFQPASGLPADAILVDYFYLGDLLASIVTKDGNGKIKSSKKVLYDKLGRPLEVREQSGQQGEIGTSAGLMTAQARPLVEWRNDPDGRYIRRFDQKGRLVSSILYHQASLLSRESRSYNDDSSIPGYISIEEPTDFKKTESWFDKSGNKIREIVSIKSLRFSLADYAWNAEGRLVLVATVEKNIPGSISYEYDVSGRLIREEHTTRTRVDSVVLYGESGERTIELYDADLVFARIFYKEDKKIKEEIIRDGNVVRTRIFP